MNDVGDRALNTEAAGESGCAEIAAHERAVTKEHHHRGRSSESLLDTTVILNALDLLPEQTIADVGCGNGYMSKAFSKALNNTGRVYALDLDEAAMAVLGNETEGTNIHVMVGDITATTRIEDSSVDLVYLSTVFHGWSPNHISGFQNEIARILKPDAKLAIVEMEKRSTPFGPPLDLRFSPGELQRRIPLAPSTLISVGEYFYMQIFENGKAKNGAD
ncbi:MAG: class I SAM-dependent methyltransferase [Planctomycetes bacterium]|nr:class I SAM-dependent methyltransferase [Planctomycetota bacterium]